MVHVRAATQQDLPFIQGWAPYSAWEMLSAQERAIAQPATVHQATRATLQQLLASPHALALVACIGAQPVGYLLSAPSPDSSMGEVHGYLIDLFVVPQVRRRGAGTALVKAAEDHWRTQGLRKLKMWSGLHNQAAIHLFNGRGFRPEGLIGLKEW